MFDMLAFGILSIYSVVVLHASLSTEILITVCITAFDTTIMAQMMMYQTAGDVNHMAKKLKLYWTQSHEIQKGKYLRRMVKSCNEVKLMVGNSGNYMERTTPLIVTQMTMEQAVSLILMKG